MQYEKNLHTKHPIFPKQNENRKFLCQQLIIYFINHLSTKSHKIMFILKQCHHSLKIHLKRRYCFTNVGSGRSPTYLTILRS